MQSDQLIVPAKVLLQPMWQHMAESDEHLFQSVGSYRNGCVLYSMVRSAGLEADEIQFKIYTPRMTTFEVSSARVLAASDR